MVDRSAWAEKLKIIGAGLERFANEGYITWSRENAEKLFEPDQLDDPDVIQALEHWDEVGAIRFIGNDREFIRVLDPDRL